MPDPIVRMWLADPPKREVRRLIDRLSQAPDVRRVAVMPDVHAAEDVCIGAVVGTGQLIYPAAVGADIGCGMTTVAFANDDADAAAPDPEHMLDTLRRSVRVLTRPPGTVAGGPDPARLSDPVLTKAAMRDGVRELGTLGRGNHFVEVQADDSGTTWVLVHSGSRAMGQVITRHHLARAAPSGRLAALDAATPAGSDYLADQLWACEFASRSRRAILEDVAAQLAPLGLHPLWDSLIDSPHNMVRAEHHEGAALLVHRKGAAAAFAGQPGIIPGSAATGSAHVEGRGCEAALCSSSHGSGRLLSRTEARRAISPRQLEREMASVAFDRRHSARLVDEAPSVYRDLRRVLAAQRDLIRITRRLRPIVSFKGA